VQTNTLQEFDKATGWFKDHPIEVLNIARAFISNYLHKVEQQNCNNCQYHYTEKSLYIKESAIEIEFIQHYCALGHAKSVGTETVSPHFCCSRFEQCPK